MIFGLLFPGLVDAPRCVVDLDALPLLACDDFLPLDCGLLFVALCPTIDDVFPLSFDLIDPFAEFGVLICVGM